MRLILTISFLILFTALTTYSQDNNPLPNNIILQQALEEVLNNNEGIKAKAYLSKKDNETILIYDLTSISGQVTSAGVFRTFLQYSDKLKLYHFDNVFLSYKGEKKFLLDGNYFQQLGKEYEFQNPIYTVRTFPENLKNPDGANAYSKWTGGMIGVMNKQMEDFSDFNKKWYLNDWFAENNKTLEEQHIESSDPTHDF